MTSIFRLASIFSPCEAAVPSGKSAYFSSVPGNGAVLAKEKFITVNANRKSTQFFLYSSDESLCLIAHQRFYVTRQLFVLMLFPSL